MPLDNYVNVATRVHQAQEQLQTVVAEPPVMITDVMGYIRVTVALKDGRSATGTASFRLDLTGNRAQATNPIEDCETSAIGRALAFLGYESSTAIASREEVQEAQRRVESTRPQQQQADNHEEVTPYCNTHRKQMRQGRNGWYCPTKDQTGNWCKEGNNVR